MNYLKRAQVWLKRQWKVAAAAATFLAFVLVRLFTKKVPKVVSSELSEHKEERYRVEEQASAAKSEAGRSRDEAVEQVKKNQREAMDMLSGEAEQLTKRLESDPETLNSFLKQVGKDVRKPKT